MLGKRIRQARIKNYLTQKKLSEIVGVSSSTLRKYETDMMLPSSSILLKLAKACNVRTEYFFRESTVELTNVRFL